MQARYDKQGRRLPDTGHGCGCQLCADSNAPRYERREDVGRASQEWSPLRRRFVRLVRGLRRDNGSPQVA
jgi:hypothetical protein